MLWLKIELNVVFWLSQYSISIIKILTLGLKTMRLGVPYYAAETKLLGESALSLTYAPSSVWGLSWK